MTNSAMMPNAERIYWYDAQGEYQSEVFTDLAAAQELYKQLRADAKIDARRVGRKPLYNYQSDSE